MIVGPRIFFPRKQFYRKTYDPWAFFFFKYAKNPSFLLKNPRFKKLFTYHILRRVFRYSKKFYALGVQGNYNDPSSWIPNSRSFSKSIKKKDFYKKTEFTDSNIKTTLDLRVNDFFESNIWFWVLKPGFFGSTQDSDFDANSTFNSFGKDSVFTPVVYPGAKSANFSPHTQFSKKFPNLVATPLPPPSQVRRRSMNLKRFYFLNKQLFKKFYFGLKEHQFAKFAKFGPLHFSHYFKRHHSFQLSAPRNLYLDSLLAKLESRLSTVLLRSSFYSSPREIHQSITYGFVFVNGVKVKKVSYCLKPGDIVSFDFSELNRIRSRLVRLFRFFMYLNLRDTIMRYPPFFFLNDHLEVNYASPSVCFLNYPRHDKLTFPFPASLDGLASHYQALFHRKLYDHYFC